MNITGFIKKVFGKGTVIGLFCLILCLSGCTAEPSNSEAQTSGEGRTASAPTLPVNPAGPTESAARSAEESTEQEVLPSASEEPTEPAEESTLMTDTEYVGPAFAYTRAPEREILYGEDFGISRYYSSLDRDGDGIDDQSDIFYGAKSYLDTHPSYDATWDRGWPPEGIGVCTDVINYGLLAAGYDMKQLIDQDVENHRDWYTTDLAAQQYGPLKDLEEPELREGINFRRVRNLWVFLEHHADSLTLDLTDLAAWQPGDIAVFWNPNSKIWQMHVVLISDRRASDGVPYVLHHGSSGQTLYEEDYLVSASQENPDFPNYKPKVLIGHYRWNGFNGE